jgi:hypothetical protein
MEEKIQEVEIYLQIAGDYCAFHEMSFTVMYDITNNISFCGQTIEELNQKIADLEENGHEYSDLDIIDAIKIGDVYYYSL